MTSALFNRFVFGKATRFTCVGALFDTDFPKHRMWSAAREFIGSSTAAGANIIRTGLQPGFEIRKAFFNLIKAVRQLRDPLPLRPLVQNFQNIGDGNHG